MWTHLHVLTRLLISPRVKRFIILSLLRSKWLNGNCAQPVFSLVVGPGREIHAWKTSIFSLSNATCAFFPCGPSQRFEMIIFTPPCLAGRCCHHHVPQEELRSAGEIVWNHKAILRLKGEFWSSFISSPTRFTITQRPWPCGFQTGLFLKPWPTSKAPNIPSDAPSKSAPQSV